MRKSAAPNKRPANRTGREADPRRTIPLNSATWQRLRASVLAGEPLCRDCSKRGSVEPATDVDHHDGDPSNNDMDNLVGLCHSCHSRKTARDHGARVGYGCDAHGMPMDPAHPWNRR
ncbi:HNH endonuclease signature motif containing protein [Achromobacter piechaudii]|uniref:HNH endonuclease signature motif containing protein n=1 Tax=Achromobacter piechaudii TaxID=72556 RepID=UPI0009D6D946|nr:HNH endonuclease signature motif containing protein [Achromobacter piechaudii]